MKRTGICVSVAVGLFALPLAADANSVVWNNGTPDGNAAWVSDLSNNNQTEADDFSFSERQTISGFRWYGAYAAADPNPVADPLPDDDFSIFILDTTDGTQDDPGGDPNVVQQTWNIGNGATRSPTGINSPVAGDDDDREIYEFEYNLTTPVTLSADDYFISFRNNLSSSPNTFWEVAASTGNAAGTDADGTQFDHFTNVANPDGAGWTEFFDQLAFQILAPAPGDLNGDGTIDGLDIDPFVAALTDSGAFNSAADLDNNNVVDGLDIDPFVAALTGDTGTATSTVPEPGAAMLLLPAAAGLLTRRRQRG